MSGEASGARFQAGGGGDAAPGVPWRDAITGPTLNVFVVDAVKLGTTVEPAPVTGPTFHAFILMKAP